MSVSGSRLFRNGGFFRLIFATPQGEAHVGYFCGVKQNKQIHHNQYWESCTCRPMKKAPPPPPHQVWLDYLSTKRIGVEIGPVQ